ncbi:glucose 1-dehydrogenase [Altericroceibacterium spongiae]|uniref:Glucose 1-dehydrogenase n=1 Tax=Altericroceibacterium spongiae TaxID=2320269 RepID=A0A420EC69_9SPHN|nr:SDR family oxidoreductase [Altericroceibacterium spongiae]RKF18253.1 glucose 1-dehydrogenase [Altericroceibacterium spongiae]
MNGRVAGKKVLITGAGQGIGAAVAHLLAQEGAQVLMTDVNDAAAQDQAAAINADLGREAALSFRLDVTREDEWIAALQFARQAMGGLSVLVNNAGVVLNGSVEDFDLDEWHRGMSINVDSVFLGCKHAIPLLRENQPGSIVNLSSIAGLIASAGFANYNASKAAVWLLSKSVALHCARKGWDVRCNSVHPTFIRTPILQDLVGDKEEATVLAKLEKQVPLGRLGEAEEVAQAVLYLASDESRFVTASELKIDGGISAM